MNKNSFKFLIILVMLMTSLYANAYDFEVDNIYYNILSNNPHEVEVTYKFNYWYAPNSYSGDVVIPSTITYSGVTYHVTAIGDEAFSGDGHYVKSVTMPNSITAIGKKAFSSLWDITSILIPSSVLTIDDEAFEDCQKLESIDIPENVTSIGEKAFDYCLALKTVTLHNSLEIIGESAFARCGELKSINLPTSLKSIGSHAFSECSKLNTITIPPYVNTIGTHAFWGCSGLSLVISEIENPFTIDDTVFELWEGYHTPSIHQTLQIPHSTRDKYMQYSGWTKYFSEIKESTAYYSFSIKSSGNGSVAYNSDNIKNGSKTYSLEEGTNVSLSFNPDNGYRIKSIKVNDSDITSSVSNNQYVTTINANTTVEVEFEAIPPITYTLSIKATGNGSASYSGETIRGTTKTYTVNEGTSVTLSFTPDTGYRIKSLKVNGSAVTASTSYTTTVNANTTVEVEFEAIPPTTYTLSIKATGNGSASYSGETIKGTTKTYTVNEGTSVTLSFTPDTGYRIKSLKVNGSAVTASTSYTTTVNANTTVEVEFEAIPPTTYTLSIKATGNGSASYSGETIKGTTKTYTVNEGTSVSISFTPDSGYRIKSLKVNGSAVTASTSYTTTVNANTTIEVEFEAIPPTTYTLSIKSTGNGSASYNGETIKGTTKTYTINEGTSVTISFTPDSGYRIKSLKVNGSAVTASNSYTTTVNANTTVEVEFEAIPEDPTPTPTPKTYTLSIKSTGNGSALYSGETIKGTTKTYTVNEGTSVTISFTPDTGYRIKSLKVNGSAVTASTSYTTTVNANTTIEVEFEAIPDDPTPTPTPKTYTLSIKSSGNGSASYDGGTIRETTKKYTIDEGTSVTITFTPDTGNRIKSLKVNGSDVTVSDKYKVTINADTSVEVAFEEIPITTYTLLIIVTGNGSASYNGETIRETTKNYTIDEGTSVAIAFTPDTGNRIKSLKVNGSDVTVSDSYKATINADTSVEVAFEKLDDAFAVDGLNYQVVSFDEHTVMLGAGDYGLTLEVPEAITYQGEAWTVDGIDADALAESAELAAVIWHPAAKMTAKVSNPNLLLYVKDEALAPSDVKNVVVNGFARSVTLTDAQSGNNFYCPEAFTVQSIVYQHSYGMKTGMNESRGWETIALPFDVQVVSHVSKGEIVPFANWTSGNDAHPFWLYELSASGFREATAIKANTPYIISMPNNSQYVADYQLSGRITFSATNAIVNKSDNVQAATYSNRTFVPNFISREANAGYYALNVNNDYDSYQGGDNEGSKFILNLRRIHPFEAYMTSTANTRSIDIFDSMITAIRGIADLTDSNRDIRVYDLSGKLVMSGLSIETIRQQLPKGVYIINNRKMIIK